MSPFSISTPQISIFDIPHILDLICDDLSKDQLLLCLKVSRSWCTNFTPQVPRHIRFSNLKSHQTWTVLRSARLIRSLTIDIADAGWFLDNTFGSSYYPNLRELHCVDFNYSQKPKPESLWEECTDGNFNGGGGYWDGYNYYSNYNEFYGIDFDEKDDEDWKPLATVTSTEEEKTREHTERNHQRAFILQVRELFGRLKDLKQLRELEIEWYMCLSISEMTLENALELFCETESSIVPSHLIKAAARQYENKTQLPAGSHDIPDCSNERPPWSTGDVYNARVGRQWKDWDDINQGCHPYAEAAQSLFPDATKAPGASQSAGLLDDDQCNEYHTLAPFFSLSLILDNIFT
ncbi:hypothetical protein K457DRAFT_121180 [Linnemannia elongata AG-77]|uniref:F-box domain-containing protein n=1 Tax=Linnemannia elongata AG-77 TaxID=1314771 RepID=A0A197KCH6_9FUNG|nr:hypothetical protein K457DRAFT_121180 [Linnemannia elongata AG-77]